MATSSKEAPIAIVNPSLAIMKPDGVGPGLAILQSSAGAAKPASKSIVSVPFPQSIHPLDPLTPAEIAVAVITVRASRGTLEVLDGMRFVEIVLNKTYKHIIALADVNSFLPLQPSILHSRKGNSWKGRPVIPKRLPPR